MRVSVPWIFVVLNSLSNFLKSFAEVKESNDC